MPVYGFSWTGAPLTTIDLPDEQAAWSQAITTVGEILKELDGSFPSPGAFNMDVTARDGRTLIAISVHATRLSGERGSPKLRDD